MSYDVSVKEAFVPGMNSPVMTIRVRKYDVLSTEVSDLGVFKQTIEWDKQYDKSISVTEEKRPDIYKIVHELVEGFTKDVQ